MLDGNIILEETPPFPLDLIEKSMPSLRLSRADHYTLYTRLRRWDTWLQSHSPHKLRLSRSMDDMEFVDYKLSAEEKAAAVELYGDDVEKLLDAQNQLNIGGYRTTFSYDQKNSCAIVSMIGRDVESPNYDKCMTTRHGTIRMALIYAVYKQVMIFTGKAWSDEGNESLWG